MSRRSVATLLALRRHSGEKELSEAIMALVVLLLWAELAAGSGRNDHRPPWMRTAPVGRLRPLRRARGSLTGRRARG